MLPIVLSEAMACLIVGGGKVALRKAGALREAFGDAARLRIVAPELEAGFFVNDSLLPGLVWHQNEYQSVEMRAVRLAFACTNHPEVNRQVAEDARRAGVLVNVADAPELCDFFLPATLRRGPLAISFASGGAPALSAALKQEAQYPAELAAFACAIQNLRRAWQEQFPEQARLRQDLLRELCAQPARNRWLAATEEERNAIVQELERRLR